ncbi:DUF2066 domain-containing protein [Alteromonadaceae bacterium M269]|nr:DUF2066 domain-containing protein [Alteromonadaceae bacterium M269]
MKLLFNVFWLTYFVSSAVFADVVTGLYDAVTRIESQSQSAQSRATRQGMEQVLVKVSGDQNILQNSDIRAHVRRANDYLLQFNFGMEDGALTFQSTFEKSKIDRIIKDAGFPIWGSRRPSTLFWLAVESDDDSERFIVSEADSLLIKNTALRASKRRGLVVDFPLLDLDDIEKVHVVDVWGRFMDNLVNASDRYDVESVLVARLYKATSLIDEDDSVPELLKAEQGEASWQLDWSLQLANQTYNGTYNGSLSEPLIDNLIDEVANQLASRFAIGLSDNRFANERIDIKVVGLENMRQLVKTTEVLRSVAAISDVSMTSITGDIATFELTLLGTEQDFLTALSLEKSIVRRRDQFDQPVDSLEFVLEN